MARIVRVREAEQNFQDLGGIGDQVLDRHGLTYRPMGPAFSEFSRAKSEYSESIFLGPAPIIKQEAEDAELVFVFDWRLKV